MPKVMIIDDDVSSTSLIKTFLELDGCEVMIVLRGKEALRKANEFLPDIFLLDYHLDDCDGSEVVQILRATATFAHTPIIMASGRDVGKEVLGLGVNKFLVKPYDPEFLVSQIFALTND